MRHVSLREFRTRGAKALVDVPAGETTLLVGQNGPAYFLVPVFGDVIKEDRELRRAMAMASLRESWRLAEASGASLASEEEIEAEISRIRGFLRTRRKSALSCSGYQRNHLCQHKCCWTAGKDHYGLGIGWDGAYSNQPATRRRGV